MIRSSSHTLKYSNVLKREQIKTLIQEYRRLAQVILDDVWNTGYEGFDSSTKNLKLPKYLTSDYLGSFDTWLSARMIQCCSNQVLGMLRSATRKRTKQYWVLAKLQREQEDYQRLQRYIDLQPLTKPTCKRINLTLDSRFVDFKEHAGDFDLFIRLSSIGKRKQIRIPVKHHRVSRKWLRRGKLKRTIRLSENSIQLIYEVPDRKKKRRGKVLGCDQGYLTAATLSDGQVTRPCRHGHDLRSVSTRLKRRKKGSKGFRRSQQHRRNYVGWALNQLSWKGVREVRLEKIRRLRFKRRQNNKNLIHWSYPLIKQKLIYLSETEGFVLVEVPNEFRSQRCSSCGWVRKANRKGKTFRCDVCGFAADADQNAASNLVLDLYEVPRWVRQQKLNRKGFYWMPDGLFDTGYEPIVRNAK